MTEDEEFRIRHMHSNLFRCAAVIDHGEYRDSLCPENLLKLPERLVHRMDASLGNDSRVRIRFHDSLPLVVDDLPVVYPSNVKHRLASLCKNIAIVLFCFIFVPRSFSAEPLLALLASAAVPEISATGYA